MIRKLPALILLSGFSCTLGICQVPPSPSSAGSSKPNPDVRAELDAKLSTVKRIYVDSFGDDQVSKTLQAMVINALDETHRFIVTENKEKADAILKGRTLESTSQEIHATGEGTAVAMASGSHSETASPYGGSGHGGFAGKALGIDDSKLSTETINDARLAVRLVASDGDVIWSSTQESTGGKFKGAGADVADKVAKQLIHDLDKATPPTT